MRTVAVGCWLARWEGRLILVGSQPGNGELGMGKFFAADVSLLFRCAPKDFASRARMA